MENYFSELTIDNINDSFSIKFYDGKKIIDEIIFINVSFFSKNLKNFIQNMLKDNNVFLEFDNAQILEYISENSTLYFTNKKSYVVNNQLLEHFLNVYFHFK